MSTEKSLKLKKGKSRSIKLPSKDNESIVLFTMQEISQMIASERFQSMLFPKYMSKTEFQ